MPGATRTVPKFGPIHMLAPLILLVAITAGCVSEHHYYIARRDYADAIHRFNRSSISEGRQLTVPAVRADNGRPVMLYVSSINHSDNWLEPSRDDRWLRIRSRAVDWSARSELINSLVGGSCMLIGTGVVVAGLDQESLSQGSNATGGDIAAAGAFMMGFAAGQLLSNIFISAFSHGDRPEEASDNIYLDRYPKHPDFTVWPPHEEEGRLVPLLPVPTGNLSLSF